MTRLMFGIIVSGAAGTAMLLSASAIVTVAWRVAGGSTSQLSPQARARLLAAWRLFPAVAACATALLTLGAFLRYEPWDADEALGITLPTMCVIGLIAAVAGIKCLRHALRQTKQTIDGWSAEPAGTARMLPVLAVDVPFPVVAVVGVLRPRLYVARQVVAGCERGELDAMIAHEVAHIEAGDNLTRLLFAATPALPFASRVFRDIEHTWVVASEEAADDAAGQDEQSAVALASALTKVARLATRPAPLVHASAILSGTGVERRVRRLLEPAASRSVSRPRFLWPAVTLMPACVALWPPVLRGAYEIAEYCVRYLP